MSSSPHPLSPWQRTLQLLVEDRKDLTVLLIYNLLNGLLMLGVPLAAQALVNTIAAGVFLQPLIVLSLLLLGGLLFAGVLQLLKMTLVEVIQQRIFAKVALRLSYRLPRIKLDALQNEYVPELANRFFDVLTIQKTWSKILLDAPTALLQISVGLLLLAFYSPILLAFDIFLILGIVGILWGLSQGALKTSIGESYKKYDIASWLEETGRCHISFKTTGQNEYPVERANQIVCDYIDYRGKHFQVLFRQATGTYLLYALVSAGILAIGGWLVINRQLTLGQLVASEIIVLSILSALEKLMRQIEPFYDLLTGVDKIGQVIDLPLEKEGGSPLSTIPEGASVLCRGLRFAYPQGEPLLKHVDLYIAPGSRVGLVGTNGSGKSTFASLLCGLHESQQGIIEINDLDIRDVHLESLRRNVGWAGVTHEIFEGTIEENILMGRSWLTSKDLRWALEISGLADDLLKLRDGKTTHLVSEGRNLSLGQRQRLIIARSIVARPQLLILDESFSAIDMKMKAQILKGILDPTLPWTVIVISHLPDVIQDLDEVFVLHEGTIVEQGHPLQLSSQRESIFSSLFPMLPETSYGR